MLFLGEFITIIIIIAAVFMCYKFRHDILHWLNRKPTIVKSDTLKDLEILRAYKVDDAIDRIVSDQKAWEEAKGNLEKRLSEMKAAISEQNKNETDISDNLVK